MKAFTARRVKRRRPVRAGRGPNYSDGVPAIVDPSDAPRVDPAVARRAISLIDLTDLNDDSTTASVEALCGRAAAHGTAAVCVWPDFVAAAARVLADVTPRVEIATVVNFPTGDERAFAVGVLTERALADGATEIDVVFPYRAWLAGDRQRAADVLDRVRAAADAGAARVKVIVESGVLADLDVVERVSRFAVDHGADFVKTSTGKTEVSATLDAVDTMLGVIQRFAGSGEGPESGSGAGRVVGIKPSGGIRTYADAASYLSLADRVMGAGWATPSTFRFGASGLLDALVAVLAGDAGAGRDGAGHDGAGDAGATTPSSY